MKSKARDKVREVLTQHEIDGLMLLFPEADRTEEELVEAVVKSVLLLVCAA